MCLPTEGAMRRPTYYFYTALICSILFAAWYVRRPVGAAAGPVTTVQKPQQSNPALPKKQTLEMMFVLDTTGSMGGLIDGAKQKIWGIVNEVLKGQMARKVRVGLVGYRDRNDTYLTKLVPLTDDLDKVYSALMQFQ